MRGQLFTWSQGRRLAVWVLSLAAFGIVGSEPSAMGAGLLETRPGGYAPTAAKDGSVYYFGGRGRRTFLLRTRFDGTTETVKISQLTRLGPTPQAITVGGDGRIWASVFDKKSRRTTIYRVSSGKVRGKIALGKGHSATAMARDSGGRTWLLGRKDDRLDFLTPSLKLRDVRVPGSAALDGITAGESGGVWAVGRKVVKRITAGGVKHSVDVAATATAEIQVSKGSVWVTASGGLQRIDDLDSTFVPLQVPRVTGTNTNSHAYFTSDNRMPLSLFMRPDGDLGFTAGAVMKAPEDVFMIASSSLGRVDASGVVSEVLPWGASYGFQFSGPYFQALTDLDDADGRTAGATTAEVDSIGNLWLATDQDGLVGYGSGTW